jgi:Domain of unknown function (DUF4062)
MPSRVLNVFLSSTGRDLWEFRQAALKVFDRLDGYRCTHMEAFDARDERAEEFCRAAVKASDLFVGILGHVFGASPPGGVQSITEIEYDQAKESHIPRLMFVAPPDFPVPAGLLESDEKRPGSERFAKASSWTAYEHHSAAPRSCGPRSLNQFSTGSTANSPLDHQGR